MMTALSMPFTQASLMRDIRFVPRGTPTG